MFNYRYDVYTGSPRLSLSSNRNVNFGGNSYSYYNQGNSLDIDLTPFMAYSAPQAPSPSSSWYGVRQTWNNETNQPEFLPIGSDIDIPSPPMAGSPAPYGGGFNQMTLLLPFLLKLFNRNNDVTPSPSPNTDTTSRRNVLERIIERFDDLKAEGAIKDDTVGLEDVDAILEDPGDYSSSLVRLARQIKSNSDLVQLADWVGNSSGADNQDNSAGKAQFEGALEVYRDRRKVIRALDHLRSKFDSIADNTGNATVLERTDLAAEITRLQDGSEAEEEIAETLQKLYFGGANGDAPRDLFTILANASGNNASTNQFVTLDGISKLRNILSR